MRICKEAYTHNGETETCRGTLMDCYTTTDGKHQGHTSAHFSWFTKVKVPPAPLSTEWLEELFERSTFDNAIIVGSEVRQLVAEILRLRRQLQPYLSRPMPRPHTFHPHDGLCIECGVWSAVTAEDDCPGRKD